jgi:O-antigen ligase
MIGIIFVISLILTNARASMLGLFVSALAIGILAKKLKYMLALIIVAAVVIYSMPSLQLIFAVSSRLDRGTSGRTEIYKDTIDMIKERPLFGIGIGNYSSEYDKYFNYASDKYFTKKMQHAHNFLLNMTAQLGMFGFIWVISLVTVTVYCGARLVKRKYNSTFKSYAAGIYSTLVGVFAYSIFEGSGILHKGYIFPDLYFWILLTLLLKTYKEDRPEYYSA